MYTDNSTLNNPFGNLICFDRMLFMIILLIMVIIAGYLIYSYDKQIEGLKEIIGRYNSIKETNIVDYNKIAEDNKTNNSSEKKKINNNNYFNINQELPDIIFEDPIKLHDTQTLIDPLTPPTSRPPSYAIAPMLGNPMFNFPTRGLPDDYSYVGNLIQTSVLNNSEENINNNPSSLLQLMGRQKYSNTSKYDYYILIPRGESNFIKVHIKSPKGEELFDGDDIIIPELGNKNYTFKKNKSVWKEFYG